MKKLLLFISLFLFTLILPSKIYAASGGSGPGTCVDGPIADGGASCTTAAVGNPALRPYPYTCGTKTSGELKLVVCCDSPTACFVNGGVTCPGGQAGINTAIGCIPISDTQNLIVFLLRWGLGIAGGIAILLIIYSGYAIQSASGDPRRLRAGQELLTSAIAGVIMLIFSVIILRFIGFDLLGIL